MDLLAVIRLSGDAVHQQFKAAFDTLAILIVFNASAKREVTALDQARDIVGDRRQIEADVIDLEPRSADAVVIVGANRPYATR